MKDKDDAIEAAVQAAFEEREKRYMLDLRLLVTVAIQAYEKHKLEELSNG